MFRLTLEEWMTFDRSSDVSYECSQRLEAVLLEILV